MIVGMNYNTDGSRYIAVIGHDANWTPSAESLRAKDFRLVCDEVYIIPLDINHKDFINHIVSNGCRIGV